MAPEGRSGLPKEYTGFKTSESIAGTEQPGLDLHEVAEDSHEKIRIQDGDFYLDELFADELDALYQKVLLEQHKREKEDVDEADLSGRNISVELLNKDQLEELATTIYEQRKKREEPGETRIGYGDNVIGTAEARQTDPNVGAIGDNTLVFDLRDTQSDYATAQRMIRLTSRIEALQSDINLLSKTIDRTPVYKRLTREYKQAQTGLAQAQEAQKTAKEEFLQLIDQGGIEALKLYKRRTKEQVQAAGAAVQAAQKQRTIHKQPHLQEMAQGSWGDADVLDVVEDVIQYAESMKNQIAA